MLPDILYSQEHGMLVFRFENPEDNIAEHHPTFIEAWKSLNSHGYDCNGWVETYLGADLGTALMPIGLEKCELFEGNP